MRYAIVIGCGVWLGTLGVLPTAAHAEQTVDIVGNVYCRSSPSAGERPWGGVRVQLKEHPGISGESEPEHGRFRLSAPESLVIGRQVTLQYAQSNLRLSEDPKQLEHEDAVVLAGRVTVQVSPRVFEVPYCVELEVPRLREMVRALLDRISHRSAVVHSELVRAHAYGSPETVECLDDVLNRMGAHLRHAESRWAPFIDALGDDAVRARREINRIKIADERAEELSREADYCLESHAPRPGVDTLRYLPDLEVSPAGVTVLEDSGYKHPSPFERPVLLPVSEAGSQRLELVPSAAIETGYDSNFLQRSGAEVITGWQTRPMAHLSLRYGSMDEPKRSGPELIAPSLDGRLTLGGILPTATDGRSLNAYSDLAVASDVRARFGDPSSLRGVVYGGYRRRVEPEVMPEYQFSFGQNDASVGGDLDFLMGGGRFDLGAGYSLGTTLHDADSQRPTDRLTHRLVLHERLRFLPETAWLHETEVRLRSYTQTTALSDSAQLRSRLGLVGMLHPRLGFTALGGWALSDFEDRNPMLTDFDGLLVHLELEWFMGSVALDAYRRDRFGRPSIAVSYDRDYRDHVVVDYYRRDRGSFALALTQADRWFWQLDAGLSYISYASYLESVTAAATTGPPAVTGKDTELRLDVEATGECRLFDGLRAVVRFAYARAVSDVVPVGGVGAFDAEALGYERFQLLGGLRWLR